MQFGKSLSVTLASFALVLSQTPATQAATPLVVINEVQCAGTDWIELYNPGNSAVNISGWLLTDKQLTTGKNTYFFPANTSLGAKRFLTLYQGATSKDLPFGVGCTRGDTVRLASRVGMVFTLVDSVTTPALPAGVSYGRVDDGTGTFGLTIATPNSSNKTALPVLLSSTNITCKKLKACVSQVNVSSGSSLKLKSVIKGVVLNSAKKLTISARKTQKFKVLITLTNKFGTVQKSLSVTVK
ncbi:MAG: hypothetical protein RIS75_77 [Actinomycetota bacterium]|jgi:hypothetical protein